MCVKAELCDRGFYESGGQPLYDDMVMVARIAQKHPMILFGSQIEHVINPYLHQNRLDRLVRLDFRQLRPVSGFRAHLKGVAAAVNLDDGLLVRTLDVVAGVEAFPGWPNDIARLTATAFTAQRGLMVHGQCFKLNEEWVLMPMSDRLAHMQDTVRPYPITA